LSLAGLGPMSYNDYVANYGPSNAVLDPDTGYYLDPSAMEGTKFRSGDWNYTNSYTPEQLKERARLQAIYDKYPEDYATVMKGGQRYWAKQIKTL